VLLETSFKNFMKKSKCSKKAHLCLNPLSLLAHLIMITPKGMMHNKKIKETMSNRRAKKTYDKKWPPSPLPPLHKLSRQNKHQKNSTINNKTVREMMNNKKTKKKMSNKWTMKTYQNHTTTITIVILAQNVLISLHK
jgi:hypothetical protein